MANLTSTTGCDSTVTLNLAVNPTLQTTLNDTICTGSNYTFNGTTYTTAGMYMANLTSVTGCDSTVTLNLAVNPTLQTTLNDTICTGSNYTFNGIAYTTAGMYVTNLTSATGCDSTVTLNLAVNPTLQTTLNDTICTGSNYTFNGTMYTCLLYTSPSPRDATLSRMPSSA